MTLSSVLSVIGCWTDDIGHVVANMLPISIFWDVFQLSQLIQEFCFLSITEVAHHIVKMYLADSLCGGSGSFGCGGNRVCLNPHLIFLSLWLSIIF
jgi:hypothetical protein